ncbi:Methyl farnesoate epoxidase-like 2 [Homarus americanus]|uniref:Methyl farnesoate epoxidase-like 2 n=1 Tax=Homarus americanus TaxID=6706 RepID=A0A8J5MZY5_HOMAM|nr:Methyl farnesoate epoxidase-like 2 [Homarus americanus]
MWSTVTLLVTVLVILLVRMCRKPSGFPPVPVLGSIPFMLPDATKAFQNWQKKFGNIVGMKMFNTWCIILYDTSIIKEALGSHAFSDRSNFPLFLIRNEMITGGSEEPLGILSTNGDTWKTQRRFTLRTLKDFGFGKQSLEPIIREELEELMADLTLQEGQKVQVKSLFDRSIINVLWATVTGKRFSLADTRLVKLSNKVSSMMQNFKPFHPAFRWRWVRKFFPNLKIFKITEGYIVDILGFIEEELESFQEKLNSGCEVSRNSFVGAYLQEMKAAIEEKESDEEGEGCVNHSLLHIHHLKAIVVELFIGGSDTTSSTLGWAIYLLASNPEIQQRVQEELDRCTLHDGHHIRGAESGRHLSPRCSSPDQPDHYPTRSHHTQENPDLWQFPDKFYPQHFLTPEGTLRKHEYFLPFGTGKRVCLGESLARLQLFLFFTTLVHRFSWRLTDDPVVFKTKGITNAPPDCSVFATKRNLPDQETLEA